MLNTSVSNKHSINIKPACSGILQKSHPCSYFVRFHVQSECAKSVLSKNPTHNGFSIVVLQVMVFGDNEILAELILKAEYENTIKE